MSKKVEQDILDQLKREHAELSPRTEFVDDLEGKLINRFSQKRNRRIVLPAFGLGIASILFVILLFNSGVIFTNTANIHNEPVQIYIYHTHNYESYLPDLKKQTSKDVSVNEAFHKEVNISIIGDYLSEQLEDKGIPVIHEKRDIQSVVEKEGLTYADSYDVTRNYIKEIIEKHESIQMVFDLHRDTIPRQRTTTKINNQEVARLVFVVNGKHQEHELNLKFANTLHDRLEEMYPSLSRGVIVKSNQSHGSHSDYNQDLHQHALLIEMGGVDNSIEEVRLAADYLSEVIVELYNEEE